jgi:nucleotide-binding universal stress UspA family protein
VRKILAAIDFSPVSGAVVEHAASLAKAFSAELTLVHIAAPDPDFVGYQAGPQTVRDTRAETLHTEHRELQATAESLRQREVDCHALLIQGPTVQTILEEAGRIEADTIVLGSRGHGALYRALLGSVSEGVLHEASCPVVVVPAHRPKDSEST